MCKQHKTTSGRMKDNHNNKRGGNKWKAIKRKVKNVNTTLLTPPNTFSFNYFAYQMHCSVTPRLLPPTLCTPQDSCSAGSVGLLLQTDHQVALNLRTITASTVYPLPFALSYMWHSPYIVCTLSITSHLPPFFYTGAVLQPSHTCRDLRKVLLHVDIIHSLHLTVGQAAC